MAKPCSSMFEYLYHEDGKGYGMDNAANAVLFAEELLDYVFTKLGYKWTCSNSSRNLPPTSVSKRFMPVFGEAVIEVMSWNIERISNSYEELISSGVTDIKSYRRELCVSATMHFSDGYNPEKYLTFCAMLAGLSVFFFANGKTRMVEVSAQILAYIMNFYIYHYDMRPYCDWFNLCFESQGVRRSMRSEEIEFVSPIDSRTL